MGYWICVRLFSIARLLLIGRRIVYKTIIINLFFFLDKNYIFILCFHIIMQSKKKKFQKKNN